MTLTDIKGLHWHVLSGGLQHRDQAIRTGLVVYPVVGSCAYKPTRSSICRQHAVHARWPPARYERMGICKWRLNASAWGIFTCPYLKDLSIRVSPRRAFGCHRHRLRLQGPRSLSISHTQEAGIDDRRCGASSCGEDSTVPTPVPRSCERGGANFFFAFL